METEIERKSKGTRPFLSLFDVN